MDRDRLSNPPSSGNAPSTRPVFLALISILALASGVLTYALLVANSSNDSSTDDPASADPALQNPGLDSTGSDNTALDNTAFDDTASAEAQDGSADDAGQAAPLSSQQLQESTSCPAMTDSIDRLYAAYLDRPPTDAEFLDASVRYRQGEADLIRLSDELVDSSDFRRRHGSPTDEEFVDLVYRTVLQRSPDPEDRDFWVANLGSGQSRGLMMLTFTESEQFVRRTGTATPLAGFLRWYPEGTHWYCGVGPRDDLPIKALTDQTLYADYVFFNGGDNQSPAGMMTVLDSARHLTLTDGSLPPGLTSYEWGGAFNGDGNYGTALDIETGNDSSWIAVFYPSPIGEQRLGWQIEL